MRLFKWSFLLILWSIITFILFQTFSQSIFKQGVSAHILYYRTHEIPIYFYLIGSFITGLIFGLIVAIYVLISNTADKMRRVRRINQLESEIKVLREQHEKDTEKENLYQKESLNNSTSQ